MLELFQWGKDLLTGNGDMDAQHKALIEIINGGIQLCVGGTAIARHDVDGLKSRLMDYASYHFGTEARLMHEHDVDKRHVRAHAAEHGKFVTDLQAYFKDTGALLKPDELGGVIEYLVRWLAYHILNTDKALAGQLARITRGMSPHDAYDLETQASDASSEPLLKALRALFMIVSEKNKALEKSNRELEKKVRQRTKELELANTRLRDLSTTDELTKLPNRRLAMETLERLQGILSRYGTPFSVIYVDVDDFKPINDLHGHDAGDEVLVWIAGFLRARLRRTDIVCRLGGDEFIAVCPETDAASARAAAEALLAALDKEAGPDITRYWRPSLSMGVAPARKGEGVASLLKNADEAMYAAKNAGGNAVRTN